MFDCFKKIYKICNKIIGTEISLISLPASKTTKIRQFQQENWRSALRSAIKFQNIPHKQTFSLDRHVKTTIQVRNGHNG